MKIAIVANSCWNLYNYRRELIHELSDRYDQIYLVAPVDEYTPLLLSNWHNVHWTPLNHMMQTNSNPVQDLNVS